MNALEKTVDLIAAITLMFLIPLLFYGSGKNLSRAILAGQAGEIFLRRVSTAGEITQPVWGEMELALLRCGCERYEIQRERSLYEPVTMSGIVVERIHVKSKEELLKEMLQGGKCQLQKGDRIKLTVYVADSPMIYYTCIRTGGNDL